LTGAGIVGATVNIVRKNDIGRFSEGVVAGYRAAFPDQPVPTVTVSRAGDGAGVLDIGRTRESKHAESAADRLKALLNGPFGHAQLEVIDATVDELLEKEQAEALKILREGDGKTANCILERLALPEVQEKIKADYLALLLTAAELNNAFGVAPRGRAITGNLAQRFIGNSSRIAMPENTTSIVSARKITQARVCQITAPSAIEDIRQYGSPVNAAKPQRTSFLEKHTTATQYFLVTEGELVLLAAPDGDANSAKAYRVKKGEAIMVGKGIWHMSVTTSPDTKFIVYNQEEGRKENNPTPPTAFICIGSVYEIGASEAALPEGIDETVIDLAAAESRSQRTVVFVSQDFAASAERCRELLPDFSNVEYVPFNQHTQLPELASIVGDTQYDGCRKVLITNAVNREEMATLKNIVAANSEIFRNVIPINTGAEGFSSVAEQKSFQKGVLGMALLAAAIPQDPQAYKGSRSYVVLKSLLKMILGTEKDADDYITNMVNPSGSIDVTMRFGYLIGRIIGPVKKLVVNGFTRIVNIFA
jgi:hypothetical protein